MDIDAKELRGFATDLTKAGAEAKEQVRKVFFKSAQNIKEGMQYEMSQSRSFRGGEGKKVAKSIDFDFDDRPNGIDVEIGPRHGGGEPGNLANIAYFGTSRGGGTVDFEKPFNAELPLIEKYVAEAIQDVL